MDKIATRTLTYVDIFEEECWSSLYDLLEEAILRSCERHGLDPKRVETWAIGYKHMDVTTCMGCGVVVDEVVECSGCGMFCTECYERDSEGWHHAPEEESQNHCGDMCPTCYEGDEEE